MCSHLALLLRCVAVEGGRPVDADQHAAADDGAVVVGAPAGRPADGRCGGDACLQARPPAGVVDSLRLLRPCSQAKLRVFGCQRPCEQGQETLQLGCGANACDM